MIKKKNIKIPSFLKNTLLSKTVVKRVDDLIVTNKQLSSDKLYENKWLDKIVSHRDYLKEEKDVSFWFCDTNKKDEIKNLDSTIEDVSNLKKFKTKGDIYNEKIKYTLMQVSDDQKDNKKKEKKVSFLSNF